MALMPKRVKHRKSQRGRIKGNATRGQRVVFGEFGLQAVEGGWVSAQTIEAGRIAATQYIRGEGRLYVIVFDELKPVKQIGSDDSSSGGIALKARQFLHTFIEQHFEANDIGIVVSVGRARATDMQDFTSSRRLLLRAIDSFSGGFPSIDQAPGDASSGGFAPSSTGDPFAVRQQTRALRDLMESLERIQGRRKAVIYITNEVGDSTFSAGAASVWNVIDYRGGVRSIEFDDLRAAMTAAMRGGVAFYVFDPAGADPLATGGNELERMSGLRKLSAATGGFAIVNSNGFTQAFTRPGDNTKASISHGSAASGSKLLA